MAPKTQFLTNDPITRKVWARDLFKVILPAIEYNTLVGTSDTSIVQMRTELGKGKGDQIKMDILLDLKEDPVVGDRTVEGTEEKLIFKNFYLTLEEVNKAVDTGGKMEEQRAPYDLFAYGKKQLQRWWSGWLSDMIINHLCGNSSYRVAGVTFAQDPTEPDEYHHLTVNDTPEAEMTSADVINLRFLDRMKQRAMIPTSENGFKVRPLMIKGKPYYRVIMHTYAFDQLRENTDPAAWGGLKLAAGTFGIPDVKIEYNGMLISHSERVPSPYENVYRCVLCGCQAACIAWGGAGESKGTTMAFVPYTKDAERYMMIRGGAILGVKKVAFDIDGVVQDYGCVTGSGYAAPLSAA